MLMLKINLYQKLLADLFTKCAAFLRATIIPVLKIFI